MAVFSISMGEHMGFVDGSEKEETEKEDIKKRVVTLGQNFSGDGYDERTRWFSVGAVTTDSS
ncbi:hypothetical protein F0U59_08195 [Archangium gephyra]|nr:hypothetical protein F0U59_08195 [Archangium gephyra]